jgi:hypothetical protein
MRPLVVQAARQTREALLAEQDRQSIDADGVAGGGQLSLHVIDREIAFAHGHGQITDAVASGSGLGTAMRLTEEGLAFGGVVSELMAEDAKGARGVAETAGDVAGGLVVDEEGTECFVLTLQGDRKKFSLGWRLSDLQH